MTIEEQGIRDNEVETFLRGVAKEFMDAGQWQKAINALQIIIDYTNKDCPF